MMKFNNFVMTEKSNCNCTECQNTQQPVFGLTDVKFVGIDFDPKTIHDQQRELSRLLHQEWSIVKDVQTATGLVIILGRFGPINSRSQNFGEEIPRGTSLDAFVDERNNRRYN